MKMKLKDQNKAMQILQESPSLQGLTQIQAPYVDLEVRGLPALQYFGNLVWQDAFKDQSGWVMMLYLSQHVWFHFGVHCRTFCICTSSHMFHDFK